MSTPRKVRLYMRLKAVLNELFEEFPDLQWFRNYHDNLVYIERTAEYIAHWSELDGYIHTYPLTKRLNGPILYHGRDLNSRPWAFASNAMSSLDPSVSWLVSVEEPDHFMVAVLNTMLNKAKLLPVVESDLFRASMGLSNCEVSTPKVIAWLKAHVEDMPDRLSEACDRARLSRM